MVSVNVSTPRISHWGRARKLGSTYDIKDFFSRLCVIRRERDLLQAYGAGQKLLQAAESTTELGVLALSAFNREKTFQTRLAGSTKKSCG